MDALMLVFLRLCVDVQTYQDAEEWDLSEEYEQDAVFVWGCMTEKEREFVGNLTGCHVGDRPGIDRFEVAID